ncbi:hypothetical protein VIGAN_05003300 [Vigna angularis var. angularis]|uniref:Uncharacterized protein n=1 Tax=Vigna angularis var. angularis TaxID=157739 RepID=A0A0S3S1K5_PHAAN|nr:hypothetical protein VIGAN_05003300 [Vigna angularis var. angularis]
MYIFMFKNSTLCYPSREVNVNATKNPEGLCKHSKANNIKLFKKMIFLLFMAMTIDIKIVKLRTGHCVSGNIDGR